MTWSVSPIRRIFRVVNGGTPTSSPENWGGDIPWATPQDLAKSNGYKISSTQRCLTSAGLNAGSRTVPRGSLIVSSRAPIGYVSETTTAMAFNQGCKGLIPTQRVDIRFFRYQLSSMVKQLQFLGQGSTFQELSADSLASIPLADPSLSIQRHVADYLDIETARIETIISKKRRLVELLSEYTDSVVFNGVSGRLTSPSSPVKSSRISWVGDIPKHFTTPWLGAFHTTQLGKMLNSGAASGPDQYPYIKNTNVRWDHFDLDDLPTMTFDASDRQRCGLRVGDVLICEGGEVGRSAVWNHDKDIFFQKALHRVRPLEENVPRYLMYCLWAAAKLGVFEVEGNQATIVHLTGEKLREHRFPWPPLKEQEEIVELIDAERKRVHQITMSLRKQIELLTERRQALISAAVTGMKSVPVANI